ncbi:hypothetical protein EJ06DRAFT_415459 [Trichodelitschia bisporula]|uniref:Uncharacterized protein n=1 Tax=Trichodelitschia bisporula TaxID=703511 RepID=A0A6G1HY84_9PEZI|nr:hypothetical protein EJ06DRAFT_415459 [Trichodelitschia bisporula]
MLRLTRAAPAPGAGRYGTLSPSPRPQAPSLDSSPRRHQHAAYTDLAVVTQPRHATPRLPSRQERGSPRRPRCQISARLGRRHASEPFVPRSSRGYPRAVRAR